MTTTLPPQFWDTFLTEYWEKKPGVFKGVITEPLLTGGDVLEALRHSAEELVGGLDNPTQASAHTIRLYIDGLQAQYPHYMKFFPEGDSLEEYLDVVSRRLEGRSFGIVLNELQLHFQPALPRLVDFLRPLLAHSQIPSGYVESAVFMGTYPLTPFGIHNDVGNDVLTFSVQGRKRFLLWPPGYFEENPVGRFLEPDPAQYIGDAIDLEVGPNDMMYWPPSWYHVAYNTTAEAHATISVGFWRNTVLSRAVAEIVEDALGEHLAAANRYNGSWAARPELPPELSGALRSLRELVMSGELEKRAVERWQRRVGAGGFKLPKP